MSLCLAGNQSVYCKNVVWQSILLKPLSACKSMLNKFMYLTSKHETLLIVLKIAELGYEASLESQTLLDILRTVQTEMRRRIRTGNRSSAMRSGHRICAIARRNSSGRTCGIQGLGAGLARSGLQTLHLCGSQDRRVDGVVDYDVLASCVAKMVEGQ